MSSVIKPSDRLSRLILEEMEPRRLFSGGVEGLVPSGAEYLTGPIFRDLDAHKSLRIADNETSAQAEQRTREIVFVDAGVEHFQQFVDDVQNNADDSRNIEVVVLDRDRDGIEQISSHLQDLQDIDAVHIISHGVDGSVKLGETTLNADSLQENSSQIALWANAFTDSGDILFYGCDLASSSIGQNLIDELGALTLTDVAASDDLTGADSQGGDWLLEYNKGKIDSNIAVSAELQQEYRSTLAATAIDDAYNIDENSILSVPSNGVLANDIDGVSVARVNGSAIDVGTEISLASGALLTLNADGSFSYDTNGMFEYLGTGADGGPTSATDSFTYEAMGSSDPNSTATVTITITGVDDPAIIGGDTSFTGDELDPVFGTLNATDVEGLTDGTYFSITNQAANGTAAIDPATGAWTFTPTIPDWFGVDSFTVTVTDDLGGTTTKVVSIMLDTLATQAVDDNYSVSENATLNSTSGWFDNNWLYRRTLSFDNTLRTENLLDFPVLIKLDSSTIDYAKTHDSGDDLRFFDQDGTLLAHEIEVWNESGTSYVWVKVPQIDASSDTDSIVMYYGNAGVVGNGQDAAGVWSNYQAVYHLNENPGASGTVIDSAGNHDGTNADSTDTAGVIGNAQDFDGSNEYINLGDDIAWLNNASGATLSIWTNSDSINGGSNDIIGFTRYDVGSTSSSRFALIRNSDEIRLIARTMDDESDTVTVQTTTSPLVAGQWQHITGTVDYASDVDNIKIYVDGVLEGTFSHNFTLDAIPNTVSNQSAIGSNEGGVGNYFDGQLDEARILLGVQSEQAIAAQYAAMTGSLVTVGFEQTVNGVLANDFDLEGDALSVVEVNGNPGTVGAATALPSGAIVTLNADGSFLYDTFSAFESLGAGASTTDSFTYQINDGNGNTHTATVTITIDGVDDAAVISGNTSYSGNEGNVVGGTLIASDVEGLVDGTYFTVTGAATNGKATIDPATGAWTFVPTDPNWFGTDQFTVTVTDDLDGTTTQVVSITIANVDDHAIISGDISYSGNEGDVVGGTLVASDVEGLVDGTYFTVTSAATNGTAAIDPASGIWTFVPTDPNWFGTDQFTVTVTDDLDGTTTQVINITLANVDDPAIISGDISYSGSEGDTVGGTLVASDVEGLVDGTYFTVTGAATNGTAAIDPASGIWTFVPTDPNWFGTDQFTVTVTDDLDGITNQVVSITLANVDDPAIISGDISYSGSEGNTVGGDMNAVDVEGLTDGTYFTVTSAATNGTAAIDPASGIWTFVPTDPNWFGTDQFTVTVTDDLDGTTTQVVSITLANVDDPATISGDISYSGSEGDTVGGDMNAVDVEGLTDGTYFTVTSAATNGTAAIDSASGIWTFVPTDSNWFGTDQFTVTVTDDLDGTTTQVVSITLANVDDPATISGDISYSGSEGNTVGGDMNAVDVEGLTDGTYFTVTSAATNGTAAIDPASGIWTFVPTDPNWFGTDQFTVTVTDDLDGITNQVVSITLANVDDPAIISGDISYSGSEGDTVGGTLVASDVEGLVDGTYFTVTSAATNGTAAIDPASGIWTFVPTDSNWFGTDQFTVTVADDLDGTTTQVVSITLAAVDDPAIISGDISYSGSEGDTVGGTLVASDVEGLVDGTYFTVTSAATNGTAAIDSASGIWTFVPTDPNWFGTDQFTVTVTDDLDGTTTQVVSITLANVDDPAIISGDISYSGSEGDTVGGTLVASDVEGLVDGTYFTVTSAATNGTAAIDSASGIWTFVPTDPNWFGTDQFTVTVTDDLDGITTQVVSITLANVDDPAIISGDISYSGNEGDVVGGTLIASDVEGLVDGTYFTVTSAATNGTAAIDPATGIWTFVPTDPNWFGTDQFTVTVTDDLDGTTTQVVSITLANVDDPAIISGDISYSGSEGDTVGGDMNATDVEGLTDGTYFTVTSAATNGTAAIDPATGAWTFVPTDPNWFGTDQFTVTVADDLDGTTTQVVSITLANVDDPAIISGDISYSGSEGDTVGGDMNAVDVEGLTDGTYFTVTSAATNGTAAIDPATGIWTFVPTDPNWFGTDQFTVTVTDDLDGITTQVINITLAAQNDLPVIDGANTGTIYEDIDVASGNISTSGSLTISDPDAGESIFIAETINGAYGTLTMDTAGNWRYQADNNSSAIQALNATDTLVDSLAVTTADGTTYNIVININGAGELPAVTTDEPEVVPTEVEEPPSEPREVPEATLNEEVLTALEEFDSEEIYTTPQIRDPQATNQDPDGISQFTDSKPSSSSYTRIAIPQQDPVLPQEFKTQGIDIDSLRFAASDDEDFNASLELALLERIEQMSMAIDSDASGRNADNVEVQVFIGATTSLTAGIVSWVLRGGSLLASLMGTAPLLNRFDPLPILKSRNDKEDVEPDDDDDTEITGQVGKNHRRVDNMFNDNKYGPSRGKYLDE